MSTTPRATRRTATPITDETWSRHTARQVAHTLWIASLSFLHRQDPGIASEQAILDYRGCYDSAASNPRVWDNLEDQEEHKTRHDLVAMLNVLNQQAGHDWAHLGHTSSDITETVQQVQVVTSLCDTQDLAGVVAYALAEQAKTHRYLWMVGRTHGQPAQVTTLGARYFTVISALQTWHEHCQSLVAGWPWRLPLGAIGNGADLLAIMQRPWKPSGATEGQDGVPVPTEASEARGRAGKYLGDMVGVITELAGVNQGSVSGGYGRQTYTRGVDIQVAASMAHLASIAQQWATDRRLESMLGLGSEVNQDGAVGSSAMPGKTNPRLCERICSLAALVMADLQVAAAQQPWLEGDVSTSAQRRELWPRLFGTIEALLSNWLHAIKRWQPDVVACQAEVDRHAYRLAATGLVLELMRAGMGRTAAHKLVTACLLQSDLDGGDGSHLFLGNLLELARSQNIQVTRRDLQAAVDRRSVGWLDELLEMKLSWDTFGVEWDPELPV